MVAELAVAYLHFAGIVTFGALLFAEWLLLARVDARELARIALLDLGYLGAAIVVLASGLARVIWFGKPLAFYLHNPVFWIKLALFVAVGLISIPPTRCFLRWRRGAGRGPFVAPAHEAAYARRYVAIELVLLALIALAAVLMARGVGLQN